MEEKGERRGRRKGGGKRRRDRRGKPPAVGPLGRKNRRYQVPEARASLPSMATGRAGCKEQGREWYRMKLERETGLLKQCLMVMEVQSLI